MLHLKKYTLILFIVILLELGFIAVSSILYDTKAQSNSLTQSSSIYLPLVQNQLYFQNAGHVQFFKNARSDFDPYTLAPTPEMQAWMNEYYWRMLTYSPYFDTRLSWYPNAWVYKDLYAIYTDGREGHDYIINNHPEWILKDINGNNLYINWECSGGTCPQYAGDFGNPDFRAYWITKAADTLLQGYIGLWIDDVNLDWRISDGNGVVVYPIDPRTGLQMTLADWQLYFAEFTEEIRAAFPTKEIVHNVIWYADHEFTTNPFIIREIQVADYINLERGINDDGLVGGDGDFGLETFFTYIDFVHAQNRRVLFLADRVSLTEREYGLAGWLLISHGNDGFSNEQISNPDNWWNGYELDLGAGLGTRYFWNSVIRRDFEKGIVLLNQPLMPTRTIQLDQPYQTLEGKNVSTVTLESSSGIILLKP